MFNYIFIITYRRHSAWYLTVILKFTKLTYTLIGWTLSCFSHVIQQYYNMISGVPYPSINPIKLISWITSANKFARVRETVFKIFTKDSLKCNNYFAFSPVHHKCNIWSIKPQFLNKCHLLKLVGYFILDNFL